MFLFFFSEKLKIQNRLPKTPNMATKERSTPSTTNPKETVCSSVLWLSMILVLLRRSLTSVRISISSQCCGSREALLTERGMISRRLNMSPVLPHYSSRESDSRPSRHIKDLIKCWGQFWSKEGKLPLKLKRKQNSFRIKM